MSLKSNLHWIENYYFRNLKQNFNTIFLDGCEPYHYNENGRELNELKIILRDQF